MVNRDKTSSAAGKHEALGIAFAAPVIEVGLLPAPCRQTVFPVAEAVAANRFARQPVGLPQAFARLPAGFAGLAFGDKTVGQPAGGCQCAQRFGQLTVVDRRGQTGIELADYLGTGRFLRVDRRSEEGSQGDQPGGMHDGGNRRHAGDSA